jgi:hypothetical protein
MHCRELQIVALVVTRETLGWAYVQTLTRIYPQYRTPGNFCEDNDHREEASVTLLRALCGSDLTVQALPIWAADGRVEEIATAVWYRYGQLPTEQFYDAIASGRVREHPELVPPGGEVQELKEAIDALIAAKLIGRRGDPPRYFLRSGAKRPGSVLGSRNQLYVHPTVACAEVHAWLGRADDDSTQIAVLPKLKRGRRDKFEWNKILALTAADVRNDVRNNGPRFTVGKMIERMQGVCCSNNLKEPSEESLRPRASKLLRELLATGATGCNSPQ